MKSSLPGIYHLEHTNKRAKLFLIFLRTTTRTWKIWVCFISCHSIPAHGAAQGRSFSFTGKVIISRMSERHNHQLQVTLHMEEQEVSAAGSVLWEHQRRQSGSSCSFTRQCKLITIRRVTQFEQRHQIVPSRFSIRVRGWIYISKLC